MFFPQFFPVCPLNSAGPSLSRLKAPCGLHARGRALAPQGSTVAHDTDPTDRGGLIYPRLSATEDRRQDARRQREHPVVKKNHQADHVQPLILLQSTADESTKRQAVCSRMTLHSSGEICDQFHYLTLRTATTGLGGRFSPFVVSVQSNAGNHPKD
ncbi:hypothetical protein SKAU_G00352690 [Synaphobranchus kaupii]|uniref:Uncharacterized protein n=1 Tax=Synaphobranchus kaupii TaxID=118154 RepID=A0A9Q1IIB5_SYNKA|nr:hypothetical protein SKAU_G00352690 [Synaphobranchus kaupii]